MHTPRALRGLPVALASLVLALSACSGSDGAEADASTTPPVTDDGSSGDSQATTDDEPGERVYGGSSTPLSLSVATGGTVACFEGDDATTDLAWFDVAWKAHTDLEEVSFELRGSDARVSPAVSVPPFNPEGVILNSGSTPWPPAQELADKPGLLWSQRADADLMSPVEGETGLLVFRVRPAEQVTSGNGVATLEDVRATYLTADGETGEVVERVDQSLSYDPEQCR